METTRSTSRLQVHQYEVILSLLVGVAMTAEVALNQGPNHYNFLYHTGDLGHHSRAESGSGGNVVGSYSYVDPNGNLRRVSYTAGPGGFHATGDTGVDKKTAEDAARIAALAPKAPEVPAPAAPVAPQVPWQHPFAYHGNPYWARW